MKFYDVLPVYWIEERRSYMTDSAEALSFDSYAEAKKYAKKLAKKYERVDIEKVWVKRSDYDTQWEYEDACHSWLDGWRWRETWDAKGQVPAWVYPDGSCQWRDGDSAFEPSRPINRRFTQLPNGRMVEVEA